LRFDASLPQIPLQRVPDVAVQADRLGFDALWTSETRHDPFLPCSLIAEHSARLHFGTAIAVSFARSPTTLAYLAWDLAAQSGGRFILGLGTQVRAHIERRFGMPWPDSPAGKLREQIRAIRAIWDSWQNGTRLNFRGQYHKLTLMSPFFDPGPIAQPRVPIYVAGVNAGMAKLAAELADGFVVHPLHSPRYLEEVILPAIEDGVAGSGRSRTDVAVSVTAFTAVNAKQREHARSQLAFYASTPSYRSVMRLHGLEELAEELSGHAARGEWERMPRLIDEDVLSEFCLITEESRLGSELQRRYAGIADRIALYEPFVPGEKDAYWIGLAESLREAEP